MNSILATVLAGLLLAAVSGITFIAYKHPEGYRRMHGPLIILVAVLWVIWATYGMGHQQGFYEGLRQVRDQNPDVLLETPNYEISSLWVFMLPSIPIIYFMFLGALPSILGTDIGSRRKQGDGPPDAS